MAQVFLYEDKLGQLDFKIRQFEAKIDYLTQRQNKTPQQVISEDLTQAEINQYERLLSQYETLKRWEAVAHDRS